jgi:hypothetical protein
MKILQAFRGTSRDLDASMIYMEIKHHTTARSSQPSTPTLLLSPKSQRILCSLT